MYRISTEQFLPISPAKAWEFFSAPQNLAVITPPDLGFTILTNLTGGYIYPGMIIDYRVKPLWGIPAHWQTEIGMVTIEKMFVDRQVKGPYQLWEHTHYFEERSGGVLIRDEVKYILPLGFIGKLVHLLLVKKRLAGIFQYRRQILHKIFANHGGS